MEEGGGGRVSCEHNLTVMEEWRREGVSEEGKAEREKEKVGEEVGGGSCEHILPLTLQESFAVVQ